MKSLQTALGLVLCLVPVVVSSLVIDVTKVMVERFDSYAEGTSEYHYFYEGQEISPWHDIPFFYRGGDDQLLSFVCEIPKGTTAKMEIHKSAPFNRVIQDVKKGEPRHYKYSGSIVNYGAIAQTWEDPLFVSPETGFGGDNDPVDVLQINAKPCEPGEVQAVRVLGCLALVDDDETDWKLIVADASDPATAGFKDIGDVPAERVSEMREWFRLYKTAEGKGPNKFGLEERAMDAAFAMKVARETFELWKAMKPNQCTFNGEPCARLEYHAEAEL